MVNTTTSDNQYRRSFVLTGINSVVSGAFGMVPYAPYISSIGFLQSTLIFQTLPMVIGAAMFIVLGLVPVLKSVFYYFTSKCRKCRLICCLFTAI